MLKRLQRFRDDERGMSFVFVGIGFMTFMAATTLAVDVGMFMTARTQAQTSADAGCAVRRRPRSSSTTGTIARATGPAVQSAISAGAAKQRDGQRGFGAADGRDVSSR